MPLDIMVPHYQDGLVRAIEDEVHLAFGPGTHHIHFANCEDLGWKVTVWWPGSRWGPTGEITVDQARDPYCRRVLAHELCRYAAQHGLLEHR